jgi:hypothetical protein
MPRSTPETRWRPTVPFVRIGNGDAAFFQIDEAKKVRLDLGHGIPPVEAR